MILFPTDSSLSKPLRRAALYAFGLSLRRRYADTIEEGLPEHIQRYVEQLEAREHEKAHPQNRPEIADPRRLMSAPVRALNSPPHEP